MKLIFLFFPLIFISCKPENMLCIKEVKFIRHAALVPSIVKVKFIDNNGMIEKSINAQKFETLFFYAFEKDERMQGYMKSGQFEKVGDTTELYIGINYFEAPDKRKWSEQKIEKFLCDAGVGLIIGRDTIKIQKCNNRVYE